MPMSGSDQVIFNKKKRTCRIVDLAVPTDHRVKVKEDEKRETLGEKWKKKTMEHEGDNGTNYN